MNNRGTVTLETARLTLRRFTPEDAPAMFAGWAADPTVTRFLRWNPHESLAETRALLRCWCFAYDEEPDYCNWAITLRESGQLIGSIGLVEENEVGYALAQNFWGNGYATEALRAVADYALTVLGLPQLCCTHAVENPASGRVMQKAGFLYDHDASCESFDHKREYLCRCYRLTAPTKKK